MRHTTHNLPLKQKEALFHKHKELIFMIYSFGGYMLRKQIRRLYHLLSGKSEADIEFDIAELICSGFLLQKSINKDTRTQMLYLSKFPKSKFLDVKSSGDVAAINWSNPKIYEQIFKVDYLIEVIVPTMKQLNFEISTDNILVYLAWTGSNLLLNSNQTNNAEFYQRFYLVCNGANHKVSYDFARDKEIADYELQKFQSNQLQHNIDLPVCKTKIQRDTERDSYNSDIERNKYFYSLNNLAGHNFIFEGFDRANPNIINLCYFDSMNSIQTKKLYQNLSYILLMMQRYLNNTNLELKVTVYTWDADRVEHLEAEECKKAYDFYRQEWVEENKKNKIMKDIGILPSNWDNIQTTYINEDIYTKYKVHL